MSVESEKIFNWLWVLDQKTTMDMDVGILMVGEFMFNLHIWGRTINQKWVWSVDDVEIDECCKMSVDEFERETAKTHNHSYAYFIALSIEMGGFAHIMEYDDEHIIFFVSDDDII